MYVSSLVKKGFECQKIIVKNLQKMINQNDLLFLPETKETKINFNIKIIQVYIFII